MLWHLEIQPSGGHPDLAGSRLSRGGRGGRNPRPLDHRGQPRLPARGSARRRGHRPRGPPGPGRPGGRDLPGPSRGQPVDRSEAGTVVHVLPKPGVTDPEARERAGRCCATSASPSTAVRTIRTLPDRRAGRAALPRLIQRVLANDAVEQAVVGPLPFDRLGQGQPYDFQLDRRCRIRGDGRRGARSQTEPGRGSSR